MVIRLEEELNEGVEKTYQEKKNALDKSEIETAVRETGNPGLKRLEWIGILKIDLNGEKDCLSYLFGRGELNLEPNELNPGLDLRLG